MADRDHIDCDGTDEAVCPYCGCVQEGSWEFFVDTSADSTVVSCDGCGKDFDLTRDISVSYSSSKREVAHGQQG